MHQFQKTGEEASNRLSELEEAGADAIDEFCSDINQQASAEKKIKLDKTVVKPVVQPVITESDQTDDKQERQVSFRR